MEKSKILNAEILTTFKPQRIFGGTYIEFLSYETVLKDDYFKIILNDKDYYFSAVEIRIDGSNLLIRCKNKSRIDNIDIRDLIGLSVIPATESEKNRIIEINCQL